MGRVRADAVGGADRGFRNPLPRPRVPARAADRAIRPRYHARVGDPGGNENANEYTRRLGAQMRNRRLARGMSLRDLAKSLHLSGHGTLVDYELGRRIAPQNIVEGYERVFEVSDGALRNLREKALAERAGHQSELLLQPRTQQPVPGAEPVPGTEPEPGAESAHETADGTVRAPSTGTARGGRRREKREGDRDGVRGGRRALLRRRPALSALAAVVVAGLGIGLGVALTDGGSSTAGPPVRIDFGKATDRWGIFWGNQTSQMQITAVTAFRGTHSLQFTVTGASNTRGYAAVGTTHELTGLRPGAKVTFYLRGPGPDSGGGVRFWAYDSRSRPTFAPETPQPGTEMPLPAPTGWKPYTWTVPKVDTVHAIGMQIYSATEQPLIVWLGGVDW